MAIFKILVLGDIFFVSKCYLSQNLSSLYYVSLGLNATEEAFNRQTK